MTPIELDPKTTALVLIDLQRAVVGRTLQPHSASDVVKKSAELAAAFRQRGATVVYVHVDLADMVTPLADAPMRDPNAPPPPADASELVAEAGMQDEDILITKRHWDAFIGTNLEKQLRQRGVTTIVLAGIATNFGVESTARSAAGLGFAVVLVEDATSSMSAEAHRFAMEAIFPRLGRVRRADELRIK